MLAEQKQFFAGAWDDTMVSKRKKKLDGMASPRDNGSQPTKPDNPRGLTFRVHEAHGENDQVRWPLLLRPRNGRDALGRHLHVHGDQTLDVALRGHEREGGREGGRVSVARAEGAEWTAKIRWKASIKVVSPSFLPSFPPSLSPSLPLLHAPAGP